MPGKDQTLMAKMRTDRQTDRQKSRWTEGQTKTIVHDQ